MVKRASSLLTSFSAILTLFLFAGCAGTPHDFHAVVLTPSTAQFIGQGKTLTITAQVLSDSTGAGVTWGLNPATGTLGPTTTMSATYNAPAIVAAATPVTVTATSISFPGESKSLQITVEPPPTITTTTLPSGSVNGAYNGVVNATGGVPPFSWSVASGTLPPGLSLSASTTNSVNIVGTPGSQGTFGPFVIQAMDADGSVAMSVSFNVTVSDLAISTTSPLANGSAGALYNQQFQATGGTIPYSWAVASGSALPAGLTLSSTGLLSGTPTAQGTTTFGVTVTDSEVPPASITKSFSLTIAGSSGTALLTGPYAFRFSGFNTHGVVVAAGSFTADGSGNISNGIADFNSFQGPPALSNQTFTGHYTVGPDNRGMLTFSTASLGTLVYAFAIDAAGAHGRLVEFDSSGTRGSGELAQQTVSTCASSTLSGTLGTSFAMALEGSEGTFAGSTPGPIAIGGRFTAEIPPNASTPGSIDTGEEDANTPQQVIGPDPSLSGSFQTSTQTARCTMSLSQQVGNMHFNVYPVLGSGGVLTEAFVVETDTASTTEPYITVGKLVQQVGYPFVQASNSFTTTSVGGLTGSAIPSGGLAFLPFVGAGALTATGGTAFTLSFVGNLGGSVSSSLGAGAISANFGTSDTFGRVNTTLGSPGIVPIFYVINTNTALCILQNVSAPVLGFFEPQSSGPFSALTIKGTFVDGTATPKASTVQDYSGVVTLDGTMSVTGTQDTSTSVNNTSGQVVTGTYTGLSTTVGNGTYTLTSPATFTGAFFIVSPTKFVMITTTAGDTNPVLTIFGDQADSFGVN
jgi:Putative Ig domain